MGERGWGGEPLFFKREAEIKTRVLRDVAAAAVKATFTFSTLLVNVNFQQAIITRPLLSTPVCCAAVLPDRPFQYFSLKMLQSITPN